MTYEYKCVSCGHEWEEEQKITDKKITICPKCNKETAERLISGGTGFTLAGGGCGWAKNGYSSK